MRASAPTACEGVCHWQPFVHQTNTAPLAGQSDTCGAGRAQLNPSVMPRRATVLFSAPRSITIHVFYWNPTQQKCRSCDDSFRSRGRPKALYAVRLGGRARVQRGGDLSRYLPPRRRLHAAAAITKKILPCLNPRGSPSAHTAPRPPQQHLRRSHSTTEPMRAASPCWLRGGSGWWQ